MSILTEKFNTKHNSAPFDKINIEDYFPAFVQNIEKSRIEIDQIIHSTEPATFKNTIEALEYSGEALDRMQKIAQEVTPLLTEFSNDIALNEVLFKRVKAVFDNQTNLNLSTEQTTLLEKKYKSFTRNGALLSNDKKTRLREIDTELAQLQLTFGENTLAETNNFELQITIFNNEVL